MAMKIDLIIKEAWDAKPDSLFFSSARSTNIKHKSMEKKYNAYQNDDLIQKKRPGFKNEQIEKDPNLQDLTNIKSKIVHTNQPFDPNNFSFSKIDLKEILLA